MEVHVVNFQNEHYYRSEVEQNRRLRHRVFVEEMGWEALRREDGLEVDQYDSPDSVHLLLMRDEAVAGGLRFTSLGKPTLLREHFAHLIQRPLPGPLEEGADWTRFYVRERAQRIGPSSGAAALYCSAMEYALAQEWTYLTFVSKPAMIGILVSLGWRVTPLGLPQMVEGQPTVAAYITVSDEALFHARAFAGMPRSLLRQRGVPQELFAFSLPVSRETLAHH
jgi:acyl-homoserine lactone synthase